MRIWLPITESLAIGAAEAFGQIGRRVTIRSADALHLVSAREHGIRRLHSSHRDMLDARPI